MTKNTEDDSAWKQTSWKGHRLAQHRAFYALSFEEKLKAVEEMADFAREMRGSDAPQERHSIDSERKIDTPPPPKIPSPKVNGATSETESRRPVIP